MAVKPREDETFLREVQDELRRDRARSFFERYGWYVVGAVALLLAAVGGFIWWQRDQEARAGAASEKLVQVVEQIAQKNVRAAAPTIDELAASERDGYRVAALFARANAQIATNAVPAAVATLGAIAADADAPQPYRDAALIHQTLLQYDSMTPGQVVERLRPYARAGNPWFGTAGELVALALMQGGRNEQAAQMLGALARDRNVPDSVRARAIQLASSLGVDAVQLDPSIEAAAAEASAAAPPSPVTTNRSGPRGAPTPTATPAPTSTAPNNAAVTRNASQ